ncbi:MAG: hypothetical protein ACI4SF_12040 [Oscillospiraceae bacterium]
MNEKSIPTIEEFKAEAIKQLEPMLEPMRRKCSGMSAEEFIETEDGQIALNEFYKINVAKYNEGKLSAEVFRSDAVSDLAWCLYMIYG